MPIVWEALAVPTGPADALTRAVLLLSALLVSRAVVVALLGAAGRLPGQLGRAASGLGRWLRPGLARRLLAVALGLGVPAVSTGADLAIAAASAVDPIATPGTAGATQTDAVASAARPDDASPVVTVVPGDTLWGIARRHLPTAATDADVARAWPRWYAVNRAVIGPDPALIRPGMRLRLPDRRSTGTSTSSHDRPSATRADVGAVARSLDPDRR